MPVHVTGHAIERWCERVSNDAWDAVRATIEASTPAIERAAAFRCRCVKLDNGARLILEGTTVVTVLARGALCPPHSSFGLAQVTRP